MIFHNTFYLAKKGGTKRLLGFPKNQYSQKSESYSLRPSSLAPRSSSQKRNKKSMNEAQAKMNEGNEGIGTKSENMKIGLRLINRF